MAAIKERHNGYLEGRLLVATPLVRGGCFEKAVIYLCSHNEEGAMGVIINQPLPKLRSNDVIPYLQNNKSTSDLPIHFGGPVETHRGFILHSPDYSCRNTVQAGMCSLSITTHILDDLVQGKGPRKLIVALGYAGWAAGQLEKEVAGNSWLTMPANEAMVFGGTISGNAAWQSATQALLGTSMAHYHFEAGRA